MGKMVLLRDRTNRCGGLLCSETTLARSNFRDTADPFTHYFSRLTDWMVRRYAKKHDGVRMPEARLDALWGGLLVPIGVIIEGVCLTHFKTASWVGAAFGMGIANCGLQVATTVTYAYTTDVSMNARPSGCQLTWDSATSLRARRSLRS
jgi:hypothetical protein